MIRIYGASDDLLEIEGDVEEELNPSSDDAEKDGGCVLACSDGTLIGVRYDENGCWRLTPVVMGAAKWSKVEATADEGRRADDTPAYSDVVTLDGEIAWVALSNRGDYARKAR
jgi:hypothetical protein